MTQIRTPILIPYLIACAGIALFSAMDAVMKGLSIAIGVYNAMFWRVALGTIIGGTIFFARASPWPSRAVLKIHFRRGVIISIMATSFFWGIARVPLAEGIALSFIAPLITLYLAAILLGEVIRPQAIIASLIGVVGVLVILSGRIGGDHRPDALWGIGAILMSAVFYAYNLVLQRQQAQVSTPVEVAFFQSFMVLCVLGLAAPFLAVLPAPDHYMAICTAALLATISVSLLSWAYARAEAQVLVSVEYTAFIWAALFGRIIFDEAVTTQTFIGTALIVGASIIATRTKPLKPAQVELTPS